MWSKCCKCENNLCYFTTYNGEKYYGLLVRATDDHNRYFIIPNVHHKKYPERGHNRNQWKIEKNNSHSSILEKYGYEIKEEDVIVHCDSYHPSQPNRYKQVEGTTGWRNGNIKVNKLFIFGAGASYGMSYKEKLKESWQPPLVNQLFSERFKEIYQKYPAARDSISILRFQENVEEYFQKEWEDLSLTYKPDLLRNHINIQYYLKELFLQISQNNQDHEANLYDVLFKKLRGVLRNEERIAVVTFNYDILIEMALQRTWNINLSSIDDYINDDCPINLFKPHGSCNWGWPFRADKISQNIYRNIVISDWLYEKKFTLDKIYYDLLGSEDVMVRSGNGQVLLNKSAIQIIDGMKLYYPALFIPYTEKDDFVLPFKHVNILNSYLDDITEIYIIGWKGNETSFNRLLKRKLGGRKIEIHIADPCHEQVKKHLNPIFPEAKWSESTNFHEFCNNFQSIIDKRQKNDALA